MEILGNNFKKEQFRVLKPPPPKPPDSPNPPEDNGEPPDDNNENQSDDINEIPQKTIEEIINDLKKEGIKNPETQDELPDYQIKDDTGEKPEDGGQEKPEDGGEEKPEDGGEEKPEDGGEEKPEDGGKKTTDRQDKIQDKENKEKERREKIKTKNAITNKINSYNTFKEKYKEVLPNRQKNALEKAVAELQDLKNSIKTD